MLEKSRISYSSEFRCRGRPLVTIRKIMTSKLLKRIGKNTRDVLKAYVKLQTREEMLDMLEKGRKRLNDAEELIRGYQV